MAWIQSILQAENGSAVQLLTITICIVILLILITWIFKKIAGTAARKKARNRIPRLSVTDWTSVGEKHQLVLVRRDNVEHLLLIGGNSDVVVEQNIVRVQAANKPRTDTQEAMPPSAPSPKIEEPAQVESNKVDVVTPLAAATAAVATTSVAASEAISSNSDEVEVKEATAELPEVETPEPEINVADASEAIEEAIAEDIVPAVEDAVAPNDTVEFESDLIASISDTLEEEITADTATPEPSVETPATEATAENSDDGQDEMQRLLDELATETKDAVQSKEPA